MIFKITLYLSLAICLTGLIYRFSSWFRHSPEKAPKPPVIKRIAAVFKSIARTIFSARILIIIKVLLIDSLFQTRLFKTDRIRWFSHICMAGGFILLLLMHALDELITQKLFRDYASTLNPYLFLRNLFGAIILIGILLSFYRRFINKKLKRISSSGDRFAIILLAIILFSGFILESLKIISYPIFDRMVRDYTGIEDREEIKPLEAFWAKEFGVMFNDRKVLITQELLEAGRQMNEESCAFCHSRPSSAFISEPLTKVIRPYSPRLNKFRIDIWLYYIHFLACFIGLAYLPFSKFFHLISLPINLTVQELRDKDLPEDTEGYIRRRIGIDACTHCGICTIQCSVAPIFQVIPNTDILPSEKIRSVKPLYFNRSGDRDSLIPLSHGNFICTECHRCTDLCPSGIRLQDLWLDSKKELAGQGFTAPHTWIREKSAYQWSEKTEGEKIASSHTEKADSPQSLLSGDVDTFSPCIQCTICSNVCPVVYAAENSAEELDYTPQQIMNLLRLSLREFAIGSRMVWNCVTCYLCQENCPQGIRVADIMYELRNIACRELEPVYTNTGIDKNNNSETRTGIKETVS